MPDFSVIIPTYNRPESLRNCLRHLFLSRIPRDCFEVIVVDDGSSLNYAKLQNEFPQARWLYQANAGPGYARDYDAKNARGRFRVFTDDDCLVEQDWLKHLGQVLRRFPAVLTGGSTPAAREANIYDQASQLVLRLVYLHYNADPERATFFASNNMAVSREVYEKVGGFQDSWTVRAAEDRTFCNKVLSLNYPVIWKEEAIVFHEQTLGFVSYCKTYFRYGRGAANFQKSRLQGNFEDDIGFYRNLLPLLRAELQKDLTPPLLSTLLLLLVWQVMNLLGFVWQKFRGGTF